MFSQVVVPLAYDQGFWAETVERLGVGAAVYLEDIEDDSDDNGDGGSDEAHDDAVQHQDEGIVEDELQPSKTLTFLHQQQREQQQQQRRCLQLRRLVSAALKKSLSIAFAPETAQAAALLALELRETGDEVNGRSSSSSRNGVRWRRPERQSKGQDGGDDEDGDDDDGRSEYMPAQSTGIQATIVASKAGAGAGATPTAAAAAAATAGENFGRVKVGGHVNGHGSVGGVGGGGGSVGGGCGSGRRRAGSEEDSTLQGDRQTLPEKTTSKKHRAEGEFSAQAPSKIPSLAARLAACCVIAVASARTFK
jgi:hypothetical protein